MKNKENNKSCSIYNGFESIQRYETSADIPVQINKTSIPDIYPNDRIIINHYITVGKERKKQ